MNVQHLSEDDQDAPDNEYEGIACPACAKVHFVIERLASCWAKTNN
jgi:hypothetical protein